jgi:hypothetical protein
LVEIRDKQLPEEDQSQSKSEQKKQKSPLETEGAMGFLSPNKPEAGAETSPLAMMKKKRDI